jgi:hypothetical protein
MPCRVSETGTPSGMETEDRGYPRPARYKKSRAGARENRPAHCSAPGAPHSARWSAPRSALGGPHPVRHQVVRSPWGEASGTSFEPESGSNCIISDAKSASHFYDFPTRRRCPTFFTRTPGKCRFPIEHCNLWNKTGDLAHFSAC